MSDYYARIESPTVIKRLFELAKTRDYKTSTTGIKPSSSILAGHRLDLSGTHSSCSCSRCLKRQLTEAMTRTFHYFDSVTVSGPDPQRLCHLLESDKKARKQALADISGAVSLLLEIRHIPHLGEKLYFASKPQAFCENCMRDHASVAGIETLRDEEQAQLIINRLITEAQIQTRRNRSGQWAAYVEHPLLIDGRWSRTYPGRNRPTRAMIAESIFRSLSAPAVYDFAAAHRYRLPLLGTYAAEWLDSRNGAQPQEDSRTEVALRMKLPTLEGVDLAMLMQMRQEHQHEYSRFLAAVRGAIDEQVKNVGGTDPAVVADRVMKDYIRPELDRIEVSLKASRRNFDRKLAASTAIGTTVTTIGLLGSMPLIIATGVAAAVTSLPQLYKFFDDKATVETSDLYFLWRLNRKSAHDN